MKGSQLNAMFHNSKACCNFVRAFGGGCEHNDSCCNDDGEKCDHTGENSFSNGDSETVLEKRKEDLCLEAKASRDSTGYRYFGKSMQANVFNVRGNMTFLKEQQKDSVREAVASREKDAIWEAKAAKNIGCRYSAKGAHTNGFIDNEAGSILNNKVATEVQRTDSLWAAEASRGLTEYCKETDVVVKSEAVAEVQRKDSHWAAEASRDSANHCNKTEDEAKGQAATKAQHEDLFLGVEVSMVLGRLRRRHRQV